MKKGLMTIILLFILYIVMYSCIILIQFTYTNMNIFVNLAFNLCSLTLMIYIIDKMAKKIDKK
jgi:hypothetical protein